MLLKPSTQEATLDYLVCGMSAYSSWNCAYPSTLQNMISTIGICPEQVESFHIKACILGKIAVVEKVMCLLSLTLKHHKVSDGLF